MAERDDFTPATKRRLKERVASLCSRPKCRVFTVGAHSDAGEKAVNIGVAAHIHAAAPGGPRYVPEMSSKDRSHFSNGIWLCQTCSSLVDRDTGEFTADVLRQWKADAERHSRVNIGRRAPTAQDAQDQLMMALTRAPISRQPDLIGNAHASTKAVLEGMDSRFRISTSFVNDVTIYELDALEPVRVKLNVPETASAAWAQGIGDMVKHGRAVRLPADGLRIEGSPLFEQIRPDEYAGANITFLPNGREAALKLALRDPVSGVLFSMDDFVGALHSGTETATFAGKSCGGMLSVHMTLPRRHPNDGTFTISTNFERWIGRDVNDLPYFDKLFQFYEHSNDDWSVDLRLEIEGNTVFGSSADMPLGDETFLYTQVTLAYCNRARVLTKHLGQKLAFRLEPPFTAEQHQELAELADIARGERVFGIGEVGLIQHTLAAGKNVENIRMLLNQPGPHQIVMAGTPEPVIVYGQTLELPKIRRVFDDVTARVEADLASLEEGDECPVTWEKGPAFKLTVEFETAQRAAMVVNRI